MAIILIHVTHGCTASDLLGEDNIRNVMEHSRHRRGFSFNADRDDGTYYK
jgi:hypothetical protein